MSDVVDLLEDSPAPSPPEAPLPPTEAQLQQVIKSLLLGKDLSTISLKALRLDVEKSLQLPAGGLDARKQEIRQLAQDLVLEAQNAPQQEPAEPAAKKRRTLAQAPDAAPASPVKTKAPKRKNAPSAYSLWALEHRATVVEDLEKELQRKPTFGEISKAVPERWKAVDEAEKALYEQKAKVAKDEPREEKPKPKAPKPKAEGKKGKGKGKGKKDEDAPSRSDFFRASPVIHCALKVPGEAQVELPAMDLVARMFKSQGVGWFSSVKFQLPVGSREVTVQAQMVMNVAGSKHWEDGEGLEEALKRLEAQAGACEPTAPTPTEDSARPAAENGAAGNHDAEHDVAPDGAAGNDEAADGAAAEAASSVPEDGMAPDAGHGSTEDASADAGNGTEASADVGQADVAGTESAADDRGAAAEDDMSADKNGNAVEDAACAADAAVDEDAAAEDAAGAADTAVDDDALRRTLPVRLTQLLTTMQLLRTLPVRLTQSLATMQQLLTMQRLKRLRLRTAQRKVEIQ
ncbi:unnamed protein product [Effrenium voratum]|uniref:HMG box domain-containing protein n=1 Tax=Effrenium voratum TaxID=2562239 RepID=A0AA36IWT1_9DINO|nr:unnamed protein product [Effrenium voratum]